MDAKLKHTTKLQKGGKGGLPEWLDYYFAFDG
jgi:hypothetical protein